MVTPVERPLGQRQARQSSQVLLARLGLGLAVVLAVAFLISHVDFRHDLHRMHLRILSGAPGGNYHAAVARLAEDAARRRGVIENLPSAGSVENVKRLSDAARTCDVQFALAQDGTAWPPGLQLVARFAKPESVLMLGLHGDAVHDFADLRGLRIGIGPAGSGTDALARGLFALPEMASLGVVFDNRPVDDQLAMAARGELDLATLVIDADTPIVDEWVGKRGLQIASFASLEAVARRLPHLRVGHIAAGDYDAVRVVPATEKHVMKVETLLVGNGCAERVATTDLLVTLAAEHPALIRHDKDTPNTTGLEYAPAAADFFANEGPQIADEYLPWLVDVMPPANWVYVVTAVSIILNAMGAGHRFRLWRIDAARVRVEGELARVFPPSTTLGDIQRKTHDAGILGPERLATIDRVIAELEALAARSRRYSLSVLVPMGQEMAYRYQEGVIYETLAVLRDYRRRCGPAPSA